MITLLSCPHSFWNSINHSALGVHNSGVGGKSLNLSCQSIGKCKSASTTKPLYELSTVWNKLHRKDENKGKWGRRKSLLRLCANLQGFSMEDTIYYVPSIPNSADVEICSLINYSSKRQK